MEVDSEKGNRGDSLPHASFFPWILGSTAGVAGVVSTRPL